jgi:protocatechuate 3,4-dioxygenase alpha subunit
MLIATPSQTVGPYFRLGLDPLNNSYVADPGHVGLITVAGRVVDGNQAPIPDCVLEIWQADPNGEYAFIDGRPNPSVEKGWKGFARVPTDSEGRFVFHTVVAGGVADNAGGTQSPHALVMVGMRGLLKFLMTRMYFPEPKLDRVLQSVPEPRRKTLIANREDAQGELAWNLFMQGPNETVFFDY